MNAAELSNTWCAASVGLHGALRLLKAGPEQELPPGAQGCAYGFYDPLNYIPDILCMCIILREMPYFHKILKRVKESLN